MINPLIVKAIKKADQIRVKLGLDMFDPINIFDSCSVLGITVRFVDINMEGMYISHEDHSKSNILLSNQRPLPRRTFTCAHELGHHIFEHGSKIDTLTDETANSSSYDDDELLVDVFAGALLMPIAGVQLEFLKRGWAPENSNPIQFYTISSVFGTGYKTLVTHCKVNRLISDATAHTLLKHTPAKILESIIGPVDVKAHFKIIDTYLSLSVIDLEVSNYIILPQNICVEGTHLEKFSDIISGIVYVAKYPGIVRVVAFDESVSYFIRIQNAGYIGLAENRHLENKTD
jgi:hypothetical protein